MLKEDNLIGNSKSMVDFLGNRYEYNCLGCSMGKGEIPAPGGTIYEDETFMLTQDPEIPLDGFLILSCKRHINSLTELSKEERYTLMDLAAFSIEVLKRLDVTQEITIVQEERSKHFHMWLFPNQPWMLKEFGKGVSYVRDICAYAQENATKEDKEKILDTVEKVRNIFKNEYMK